MDGYIIFDKPINCDKFTFDTSRPVKRIYADSLSTYIQISLRKCYCRKSSRIHERMKNSETYLIIGHTQDFSMQLFN